MINPTFSMKVFFAIAFLLPLFGSSNAAFIANKDGIEKRDSASPIVLDFDVKRGVETIKTRPQKAIAAITEADAKPATLDNAGVSYLIDIAVGSDKQKVSVVLDTGSSDLWVIGPNSNCNNCATYDPSSSSTNKNLNVPLFEVYGSAIVLGGFYSDDVSFGQDLNVTVSDLELGVAQFILGVGTGILGIGFESLEGAEEKYTNFPAALAKQGIISKNAYSLYLNDLGTSTGTIIFGGYDTEKYSGDLVTLPITNSDYLAVEVPSISVKGTTISYNKNALLDSGTTLSLIARSQAEQFANAIGSNGTYTYESQEFYEIDCDLANSDETFDINFTKGATIKVPIKDFVYSTNNSKCASAFIPQDGNDTDLGILGDVFLRNAYLVYDLEDKTIQVAQVKYTDESNIVSF